MNAGPALRLTPESHTTLLRCNWGVIGGIMRLMPTLRNIPALADVAPRHILRTLAVYAGTILLEPS